MNSDKLRGFYGVSAPTQTKKPETFREYWKRVMVITEAVCGSLPGIEKRGFNDHHIDHIISIWKGFKMGLPAEEIGGLSNLRMLPYKDNLRKGRH